MMCLPHQLKWVYLIYPKSGPSTGGFMTNNVVNLPTYGKAISLDDEGIYFILNASTGAVQSIFQLVYDDDWYLYQLEATDREDEASWTIMAEGDRYSLISVPTTELARHFSKPEYAEPRGAWQVIRNAKYGFGKFTPVNKDEPVGYAMIMFQDNEMLMPVRIHKADEETLKRAEAAARLAEEAEKEAALI